MSQFDARVGQGRLRVGVVNSHQLETSGQPVKFICLFLLSACGPCSRGAAAAAEKLRFGLSFEFCLELGEISGFVWLFRGVCAGGTALADFFADLGPVGQDLLLE